MDINHIIEAFKAADITVTAEMAKKLNRMSAFMLDYNEKVNLTRITEPEEIIEKHYIDSILPLKFCDVPENATMIDVGTGAGFPSVPMLIYRPDLAFTLCDSLNKRVTYLDLLAKELNLTYKAVHGRSEELSHAPAYRERFDFATARAVANLPALCEYCLPFVKVGGTFIAMKGADSETEHVANSLVQLGGAIERVIDYTLPSGDKRCLILIKKISHTPTKYPRSSVNITKKPL